MRQSLLALAVALGLALGCRVGEVRADPITINLATGLDASNNLITTGGAPDAHWTVRGNPAQVVVPGSGDSGFPDWIANGPNSAWIARNANDAFGNGLDTYTRTFDLTGFNPATASITGFWTLDDGGTLSLNGHLIGTLDASTTPWFSFHAFSVPAGSPFFNPGVNTLQISITQTDTFLEGVRLQGTLTAEAAAIPEPTSVVLFGLALVGGALCAWRRRRQIPA
jgi:hypothetical protein